MTGQERNLTFVLQMLFISSGYEGLVTLVPQAGIVP